MLAWIQNLAIYMVISGLLLEMIAETKYYKFARWVVGVMLMLQLMKPVVETGNLWERFLSSLRSFDYALGTERVLEEIYAVEGEQEKSVLESYKKSIELQVEKLLQEHEVSPVYMETEVSKDGTILSLYVCGQYLTEEEKEDGVFIPTVAPVEKIHVTEKENSKPNTSPMEIYLCEKLAEFYHVEENKRDVEIREASG